MTNEFKELAQYKYNIETYSDFVRKWKILHNSLVEEQRRNKQFKGETQYEMSVTQSSIHFRRITLNTLYIIRRYNKELYKMEIENV